MLVFCSPNQNCRCCFLTYSLGYSTRLERHKRIGEDNGLVFDAVNSNTFQDQKDAKESYRFGSLSNLSASAREQAIAHNIDVIKIGEKLGSKSLRFGWQMVPILQVNVIFNPP